MMENSGGWKCWGIACHILSSVQHLICIRKFKKDPFESPPFSSLQRHLTPCDKVLAKGSPELQSWSMTGPWFCNGSVLTRVRLNRAFRPNYNTNDTTNHHHQYRKQMQCGAPLKNTAVPQPERDRERIQLEQINLVVLLSFQDTNAKITPSLPVLFQSLCLEKLNWERIITKRGD